MTTTVYPSQDLSTALNEERKVSILELAWLLGDLSVTIKSLADGIEECIALLNADQPGSTLVLSSNRSEALKGFIVRVGQNVTKAEIRLKLSSLNKGQAYSMTLADDKVIPLAQLGDCSNFLAECLRIVTELDFVEPGLVLSLRKLITSIRYAHLSVRNVSPAFQFPYTTIASDTFAPEIPENVAVDITISESGIVADVRTLQVERPAVAAGNASVASSAHTITPRYRQSSMASVFRGGSTKSVAASIAGGSVRSRLPELTRTATNASTASDMTAASNVTAASTSSWFGSLMGRRRQPDVSSLSLYKGQYVKTVERITVQSLDPGLMALISKLNVLELNIGQALRKLEVAMNWK